jgi:circadian clock protein KaiB
MTGKNPPDGQLENPEVLPPPELGEPCRLRLYIARPTPSSGRAEANLAAALAAMPGAGSAFTVDFVDVIENPHQAVKDRIIVTPCLVVMGTTPTKTLFGDLQDFQVLRLFLERAHAR